MAEPVNPYVAGSALRWEKGFYGRQDTLKWVAQELRNPGTNALVLSGQRRIGKTTLLLQLERILPADIFLPVYFDLEDQTKLPLRQVLADLADTVAKRANWKSFDLDALDDQGRFFRHSFLPQLYQVLGESRRLVLLLDEFDVLDQIAEAELPEMAAAKTLFPFLRTVMTEDSRPAFVFVVGRQAEDLSLDFTATFKGSLMREIWALDRESAESLVRQAEANSTLRFTDRAVERILSLTSCHPYLTQLLCQRIWGRAYVGNPTTLPQIDVPEVDAAVPDVLEVGEHALIWLWKGLSPTEKIYAAALAEAADREEKTISEDQVVQVLTTHAARLRKREVELAPRDLVKRRVLVEVSREGEYRFAVELFRHWVRQNKPLQSVKDELDQVNLLAEWLFDVGWRVSRRGEWDIAIRYFQDALRTDSRHFGAQLHLGKALLELGQADQAVVELKKAFEMEPDEASLPLAHALVAQAGMRIKAGDEDGALIACEQALQISPNEQTAQQVKADIWIRRVNAAIEQNEPVTALFVCQPNGAGRWEDALVVVQRALEIDSTLFHMRLQLAGIFLELGRTDEALSELDSVLVASPQADTKQRRKAVDFLYRILARNPNCAFVRIRLGHVLLEMGQIDKAVAELERAYELDPEETRLHLTHALVVQAQATLDASDWLAMLSLCVRVMQIDPMHPDLSEMVKRAIAELQRERVAAASNFQKMQEKLSSSHISFDRHQLGEILANAENRVRLLGVVALEANWQALAKKWAARLRENPGFEITILCESDNMLFSKSFTCDVPAARNRRSFLQLQFIRDRATKYFPELLLEEQVSNENKQVKIEVMHLPVPISIVQVDSRIFANLWLHEVEDYFEEITQDHPWHSILEEYMLTYFSPERGRKYACDPKDEMLELFDHERVPRGIYPRGSFYDTDYSQLVVWAFIFDRQGRLLIHRRSENAKDNQGMWDKSAGGHTNLNDLDTSRAVPREVIEELYSEEKDKEDKVDFSVWDVSDKEIIYLGEWRPNQRKWHPFNEIRSFGREWVFFRLRDSTRVYSPRSLPDGKQRRLRVIADVFLFVAGSQLNDISLRKLKNSKFKLIELSKLKDAMDQAMRDEEVPGFDEDTSVPRFTPDLKNIMTGELRNVLEEFAEYIRSYVGQQKRG
jgi:tetratricopeptide (TPR) repeat protein